MIFFQFVLLYLNGTKNSLTFIKKLPSLFFKLFVMSFMQEDVYTLC